MVASKVDRYSRQILFRPIGSEGQEKIKQSSALIVGMGALGTVIANHLTRAGIGYLRIVDRDLVEMSNLQRQTLFTETDAKELVPKAIAAKRVLETYNSEVEIDAHVTHVAANNMESFMEGIDIVFDGTDNFSTRYLMNDSCYKMNIPFSYGGVIRSRGMTALFNPNTTSCLRCLMNEQQSTGETCDTVGVISPIVDIVSSLQVTDGLKYLTKNMDAIRPTLRTFDIWNNHSYEIKLPKKKTDCPVCIHASYPALDQPSTSYEQSLCGRNSVQILSPDPFDLTNMEKRLQHLGKIQRTPFLLKVKISASVTFVLFANGRVLVQGTDDLVEARSLFDRYIGS